jgi:hypothetical protein
VAVTTGLWTESTQKRYRMSRTARSCDVSWLSSSVKEFERCYVLLIQPTVEPCAGKVWLTNDPHFTFGLDAICSEFLADERIPILPPGGRFISKIKLHNTPSHYQITQNNSQWRVQNTIYRLYQEECARLRENVPYVNTLNDELNPICYYY